MGQQCTYSGKGTRTGYFTGIIIGSVTFIGRGAIYGIT